MKPSQKTTLYYSILQAVTAIDYLVDVKSTKRKTNAIDTILAIREAILQMADDIETDDSEEELSDSAEPSRPVNPYENDQFITPKKKRGRPAKNEKKVAKKPKRKSKSSEYDVSAIILIR